MRQADIANSVKAMPGRKIKPAFSHFLYKYRNLVERFFSKIKHFRAVATRYDKRDDNFLASVQRGGSVCLDRDRQGISGSSAGCFLELPIWGVV